MNKVLIRSIILLIIFINNINLFFIEAEAKEYIRFNNITIEDGLSQGTVESIMQDSDGYMWFGTNNGLNKFNGYEFKTYTSELNNKNSLQNDYIFDIAEDLYGNIWVATLEGVSRINKNTDKIDNYLIENMYDCYVSGLLLTSEGKILAGTAEGLYLYNESEDEFQSCIDNSKLKYEGVEALAEDKYGDIWLATGDGLMKANLKTKETKEYESFKGDQLYTVYCDDDTLWIGSHYNGVYKMDIKTEAIVNYQNIENDDTSLPGSRVKDIIRDSKGNVWICVDEGLARLDEENNAFITYKKKNYDSNSLANNNTFSIIEDKYGLLWVGTYSGVSVFNPYSEILHYKNDPFNDDTISDDMIKAIYEDEDGLLWIGTDTNGIDIFDKDSKKLGNISTNSEVIKLSNNIINAINGYEHYIFVSTYNGLNIIDKKEKKTYVYTMDDGLMGNNMQSTLVDDEGRLWIATSLGVSILDKNGKLIGDINDVFEHFDIGNTYVKPMLQDSRGNIWIGCYVGGGLVKINVKEKTIANYKSNLDIATTLSDDSIVSINEDSKGNLWIGTAIGLNKYDYEKDSFTRYTTSEGLPNNTVYAVLFDSNDNPWISTNMGIAKFDVVNNRFINYTVLDGLQSNEFNGRAAFKCKDGRFIFGGINGYNILNPESLEKHSEKPTILIDKLLINGVYSDLDLKNLDYKHNNISIKFFSDNYKDVGAYTYLYKLEGYDEEWHDMISNDIVFSNLAPGKYKYKFKVLNSNGIESDELELEFKINPPIWKSHLAIIIYIFIFIGILITYKRKVTILNSIVNQRTKKLTDEIKKNEDLFNKNIELERNKNLYFVNLSHELRTPLNVIYSTKQLIKELNKTGISKDKIDYYMGVIERNTNRLLTIINDIIDASKIESGNYKINKEPNDIVYLVEETVLSLKDFIEGKGISLIVDPHMEEKIINCDSEAIERCIINLVNNAGKFSNEGDSITVTIKEENDKVIIKVIDTGIGIEKQYHKTIFNRFKQVTDENSKNKGGSGLGLTITKQIVELHKGEIFVESEVGQGTTFTIILPAEC